MEIKDRMIRIGKIKSSSIEGDCFIIDEYGIEGEEIYHRNIVISKDIYKAFEKNPDSKMLLDEFLEHHNIYSEWKRYELNIPESDNPENEMESSSRLFNEIDLDNKQSEATELSEHTKNKIYKKVYNELSKNETLIHNPSIMYIFNEAMREDSELAIWESVFPFFR